MPGYPKVARAIAAMPSSVYSSVTARLKAYQGEVYPLHIGDTWMEPAVGCRMEDLKVEDHPGLHRYTPSAGLPELRTAIAQRTEAETGSTTGSSEVLISAGATAALSTVVGALVDPGDEVLIMAPYWPLIGGMVRAFRGEPVEVPFFAGSQLPHSPQSAVEAFRSRMTKRTVAIYLNTPHNPSGRVLPADWSQAILRWATEAGLWVLSDEVYAPFVYVGEHSSLRPLAPERTVTIGSFSKAYGMTGNRCGYLVGPAELLAQCNKIGTNTYYCAPRASQVAALAALSSPLAAAWVAEAKAKYHRLGRMAAEKVGLPEPEGSTFLFLNVADQLGDRGLLGFLEDCADRGLLVASGPSFGPYPTHIRVCFTCAEPPLVERGFEVLARLLG